MNPQDLDDLRNILDVLASSTVYGIVSQGEMILGSGAVVTIVWNNSTSTYAVVDIKQPAQGVQDARR